MSFFQNWPSPWPFLCSMMMDLKDNTYEDIEETSTPTLFKSQSDSNLLKLLQECGQEVEIINSLIKGQKKPTKVHKFYIKPIKYQIMVKSRRRLKNEVV